MARIDMMGKAIRKPANEGFLPAYHEIPAMMDADKRILRTKKLNSIYLI
jgi:hypothetical protein